MDSSTLLAVSIGLIGIIISIVIWLASTRAAKISEREATPSAYLRKIDEEAYERARKIYEAAITQLESKIERLNKQVHDFQNEVSMLNSEVIRLRRKFLISEDPDESAPAET